ncbi:class I lanthipeptide [Taibaiella chishuiensis]|uniref:Uncharacterized protein n=1 Tax=Taibaiella chishuiensis TaxID=1434707 RepID=A0A2P8DBL0_9BACT|nr:class I lanthipeptide [Taibaiella chishuiensis]PSK94599.1 hypothetical protein B0I18_101755 [Taibaiella chishuiensis]
MKKKNITLNKKLFLAKETIVELNKDATAHIAGGKAIGTIKDLQKTPVGTGTGCECAVNTCGIVVCSYNGTCDADVAAF